MDSHSLRMIVTKWVKILSLLFVLVHSLTRHNSSVVDMIGFGRDHSVWNQKVHHQIVIHLTMHSVQELGVLLMAKHASNDTYFKNIKESFMDIPEGVVMHPSFSV